jgi:hypothetical protein
MRHWSWTFSPIRAERGNSARHGTPARGYQSLMKFVEYRAVQPEHSRRILAIPTKKPTSLVTISR